MDERCLDPALERHLRTPGPVARDFALMRDPGEAFVHHDARIHPVPAFAWDDVDKAHDPPRRKFLSGRRPLGRSDRARHAAGSAVGRRRSNSRRAPRSNSATAASAIAELEERVEVAASAFLRAGYGKNHSVALFLGNSPDHPVNFFGALKAGARIVHLSPLDGAIALSHKLSDSGARVLVTSDLAALLPTALKFLEKGLLDRLIVCEDDDWGAVGNPHTPIPDHPAIVTFKKFTEGAAKPAQWPVISADDTALLQYTGGTTGLPKGAMLSHGNLTSAVSIYEVWGSQGARRTRRGRARDLRAAAVSHLRADGGAAGQPAARQPDLAAPALRCRGRHAGHRGQARDRVPRRAHDVDRDRRAPRSRQARPVVAGQLRLRRRAAAGRSGKGLRAQGRHEAQERLGHDRDLLARYRASQGRARQAGLDRADAARHRNGRGRARRSQRKPCRRAKSAKSAFAART